MKISEPQGLGQRPVKLSKKNQKVGVSSATDL